MFLLKPTNFTSFTKKALPWLGVICFACFLIGMFLALFFSPGDYKQGEIVRIMYLHVPSAWLALGIYGLIASLSFISLVWNNSVASVLAHAAAPAGTVFSAICLITGSIWGKGTWGTWWVWDARLTSMLILFFLYVGYLSLWSAFDNQARAEKSSAVFAIFSAINIPIVKFSVNLWSTLHQPASIFRKGGVAIEGSLLLPLIAMFIFCATFFLVVWILNALHLINLQKIKREISMRY
ncbi:MULTISPECIES: heme ABC transporter permease CcmC [Wolbachia]|uniref:heme ABC transporter permease CcmC n=1 Tax=Wolbachia TaxID=953 RepID=UPI001BAB7B37|nr:MULTISPECIES: heme ABC transporter permease CcmC [unclassified Wolbachia]QUI60679.1 cytochrome c biogenesis protein CcsA [Wolbachia endosymbiont of Spodoptera picta]URG39964.1 heme ABC transporter permease CcmC [Wolbachia endosymbiont of Ostrinia furnacalis]URG41010.1 heme ABC transporter permease CcmC [Wolbachia endosymbiont of Ostrinia scapulalis]BDC70084.1 heme ABC transporter permease CcmC [Wolbachia sp.]